jgi:hypothetical protein
VLGIPKIDDLGSEQVVDWRLRPARNKFPGYKEAGLRVRFSLFLSHPP